MFTRSSWQRQHFRPRSSRGGQSFRSDVSAADLRLESDIATARDAALRRVGRPRQSRSLPAVVRHVSRDDEGGAGAWARGASSLPTATSEPVLTSVVALVEVQVQEPFSEPTCAPSRCTDSSASRSASVIGDAAPRCADVSPRPVHHQTRPPAHCSDSPRLCQPPSDCSAPQGPEGHRWRQERKAFPRKRPR